MGIKTYQEKNTNPTKKELAQLDIPVKRKIQKTSGREPNFHKNYMVFWAKHLQMDPTKGFWGPR